MNESTVRLKINHSLQAYGYWPITNTNAHKCGNCGKMSYPASGRPDILVLHPTATSAVVEVKTIRPTETGFPFARIEDKQRRWLSAWSEADGLGFLGLGVLRKHGKVTKLDDLYLVEWGEWLRMEAALSPIQNSIPYNSERAKFKIIRERELDVIHLLVNWRMRHVKGDIWEPTSDCFA